MKRRNVIITVLVIALFAVPSLAMQGHSENGSGTGHEMKTGESMDHGTHGQSMTHGDMGGAFKHTVTEGGVQAEFQVMSLASMNMTSDKGETHHIMVNLKHADDGASIKDAIGKIKVIAPDKTEQVSPLKNYSGILAANFTFKQPGKYGVICLMKNNGHQQVFKFWYHHM